jgi:hypothetical protein
LNTPSHILYGAALFGGRNSRTHVVAAAVGSLAPDLPAFMLVWWAGPVQGVDRRIIFRELYFSDAWQAVISPSHSVVVWLAVLAVAAAVKSGWWRIVACAGLLHLAFDFPAHASDPHRHLWPLSDWRFHSPLSYWERGHYRGYVQAVEIGLALASIVVILMRQRDWLLRGGAVAMVLVYAIQMGLFALWFGG